MYNLFAHTIYLSFSYLASADLSSHNNNWNYPAFCTTHIMAVSLSDTVEFRSVIEEDFAQIKKLHEDLFPVRYSDNFYSDVCSSGQGHTHFFNPHDDCINGNQSEKLSKHRHIIEHDFSFLNFMIVLITTAEGYLVDFLMMDSQRKICSPAWLQ